MTPDDIINLRHVWRRYTYSREMAKPVILASADWTRYVTAMADAMPPLNQIEIPTMEEIRWAWPDGVVVVFEEPVELEHLIISHEEDGRLVYEEPHHEIQLSRAISFASYRPLFTPAAEVGDDGRYVRDRREKVAWAQPVLYIGVNPDDIITGRVNWGEPVVAVEETHIAASLQLTICVATALGHRLTTLTTPRGPRAMMRRMTRELPDLRVIELAHAGSKPESRGSSVEWSRRWVVRGHWRDQAHGPAHSLRKLIWVDPYVKGPDDKPLDVRPTVWKER